MYPLLVAFTLITASIFGELKKHFFLKRQMHLAIDVFIFAFAHDLFIACQLNRRRLSWI